MPSRDSVRSTRRKFLSEVTALTVISSHLQGASSDAVTPLVAGPEIDAFREAQARSAKFGYRARSRFIKIAQPPMTLHVLEAGHGNPVVLLSGGPTVVQFAAPLAGPLSREFHTFAMDRPGCGLSDRLDYRGTPNREQAVTCIGSLLDTLKLRRVALVGNSMGGFWALAFALARPERVSKLVFLGELAGSSPPPPQPPVAALPSTSPASPSMEGLRARYAARLVAHVERVPPEILQAVYAAEILPGYAQSTATMMEQVAREGVPLTYALRPELKNLKPETLFIWGDHDKLGPAPLGREMASMIPRARCEVVKEAGHLPWLDQSELCIRLTRDFLRQSWRQPSYPNGGIESSPGCPGTIRTYNPSVNSHSRGLLLAALASTGTHR